MKKVIILGSTGSIGRSALDVISNHRNRFSVVGLAAGSNISLLEEQIKGFSPEIVAVANESAARELKKRIGTKPYVCGGEKGVATVAAYENAEFVLSAMTGFSGLIPTIQAIRSGKTIGLANKETLVTAGAIVMREAESSGVQILPVDSEHSAISQCVSGHDTRYLRRIILTASGGPFLGKTATELEHVGPEDALRHPNWSMGKKITIDSATLMNKGLEVIEAACLFGLSADKIDVVIHPQSIVHSLVEFTDGTMLAQMSVPDMRGPIAYALSYPERLDNAVSCLDLDRVGKLSFQKPDTGTFPCLGYAYDALRIGGTMPAVLNAANETTVSAFLDKRISFRDIPVIINDVMGVHAPVEATTLDAVIEADRWAREESTAYIKRHRK